MALLAAIAAHFRNRHPVNADGGERFSYRIQTMGLNNRDNEFQRASPRWSRFRTELPSNSVRQPLHTFPGTALAVHMIAGFAMNGEVQPHRLMLRIHTQSHDP